MKFSNKTHTNPFASMNEQTFAGQWEQAKGKLKQKYAQLTDDDLTYEEGKEDELYGRIGERLGHAKDEIKKLIAGI